MSETPDPAILAALVAAADQRDAAYQAAPYDLGAEVPDSAKLWLIGGIAALGLLLLMMPQGGRRR